MDQYSALQEMGKNFIILNEKFYLYNSTISILKTLS